jgi:hypothetical protein
MKLLTESKVGRKCGLWINEFDTSNINETVKISEDLKVTKGQNIYSEKIQIVIELFRPQNHSYYALLGFEYVPGSGESITVQVCVDDESNVCMKIHCRTRVG